MSGENTLPKSSPGRAVKPAARQLVERDQTVGCVRCQSISQHERLHAERERGYHEQAV
jgi:hypothetical protein